MFTLLTRSSLPFPPSHCSRELHFRMCVYFCVSGISGWLGVASDIYNSHAVLPHFFLKASFYNMCVAARRPWVDSEFSFLIKSNLISYVLLFFFFFWTLHFKTYSAFIYGSIAADFPWVDKKFSLLLRSNSSMFSCIFFWELHFKTCNAVIYGYLEVGFPWVDKKCFLLWSDLTFLCPIF